MMRLFLFKDIGRGDLIMEKNMKRFMGVIKEARINHHLLVSQLAEKVVIFDKYILKIENKTRSYRMIKRLANVLTINANVLYYDNFDYVCRKFKKYNKYKLTVIRATLNILLG